MLLLNYYSLKSDRSKGLQETYRILLDLFSPYKGLAKDKIRQALAVEIRKARGEAVGEKEEEDLYEDFEGIVDLRGVINQKIEEWSAAEEAEKPAIETVASTLINKANAYQKRQEGYTASSIIKIDIKKIQAAVKATAQALQAENKPEAHEKALEDLVSQYQAAQLQQYLPSILIGITQVPSDGITSPKSLEKVRNNFADYPLLHKVDGQDNPNIFTFDLWDETIPGGLDRARILARLAALPPIKDTRMVFGSVLLASDEQRLREISDTLSKEIATHMETKGGFGVRELSEQAQKLDIVNHPKNLFKIYVLIVVFL